MKNVRLDMKFLDEKPKRGVAASGMSYAYGEDCRLQAPIDLPTHWCRSKIAIFHWPYWPHGRVEGEA